MNDGQAPVTIDDEWPREPTKPDRAEDLRALDACDPDDFDSHVARRTTGYPSYDELARHLGALLGDPSEYEIAAAREAHRRATTTGGR